MKNEEINISMMTRLSRIILVLGCFLISITALSAPGASYAQTKKFTFELTNTSVKNILRYLENESDFAFVYEKNILDDSQKISVKVSSQGIEQILDQILNNTSITYEIIDRQVILKKKAEVQTPMQNQKKLVLGIVKDDKGEPIIGASIQVKGTSTGTITDADGLYNLYVPSGQAILIVSFIGYDTQEVPVDNRQNISVTLKEVANEIEEVVVTAFGVGQKKSSLTGSIQQIRPAELKVPSSSLSTSFGGRLAGVIAVQRSGQPGADGADFWIRGKSTFSGAVSPLIILDGMQVSAADLNALDPEVIESFSILKDATATAMYGTLGANGVMVVATKSGADLGKPIINFRIEGSMSQLSKIPSMVDGATYMELYNEAASRSDAPGVPYSQERIDGVRAGKNPILYPNVNWYDELFNKNSFGQKVNINIRGGSSRIDYFMSVGVKHDSGNLKSISRDYFSFNNNINLKQYDFVNNLNIKLTKSTKVSLGLNVGLRDYSGPAANASDYFGMIMNANPADFPISYPAQENDTYIRWGGKQTGRVGLPAVNPMASMVSGYSDTFTSKVIANLKLEQKLDMVTKGLKFTGMASFKNWSSSGSKRTAGYNQFEVENYDPTTEDYTLRIVEKEVGTTLSTTSNGNTGDRKFYFQGILDYTRKFNEVHDVNVMFLYNQEQYNTNMPSDLYSSLPKRKQGIAGRVSYAYDDRYMTELNFGYNGSENFAKGHRFGFFPSVAVGYNISQEKFWDEIRNVVSHLKIRASWGLVGNDYVGTERFAYLPNLSLSSQYPFETGFPGNTVNLQGPKWTRVYNPDLTWEVGEKMNLGLDLQFFNALTMNLEFFKEIRKNIFQKRSETIPSVIGMGGTTLYGNVGKMQNQGFEAAVDYNKQIDKNWFVSFKGTFTFARNKILIQDEPVFQLYPNLSKVGGSDGRFLGYLANGLYPNQGTIDENPKMAGKSVLPGDIWYQDIADANGNKSGTITADDRVWMGYPATPEIVYGFGPSIKYKKWDISFFFQGVAHTSLMMSNFHPFGDYTVRGVLDFVAEDRWTEQNPNPQAKYPRLKLKDNINNEQTSSYWLRNAAFLKLRNAEIGYTYKKMRFYLSGANLLTFSPFKHWDPEMGGGNGLKYPTQRTFNIGFQMTIN